MWAKEAFLRSLGYNKILYVIYCHKSGDLIGFASGNMVEVVIINMLLIFRVTGHR